MQFATCRSKPQHRKSEPRVKTYVDIGVNMLMVFSFLIRVTHKVRVISCQRQRRRHILTVPTIFSSASAVLSLSAPLFSVSFPQFCGAGKSEAVDAVSAAGFIQVASVAVRGTAVHRAVVPATSAQNTPTARCRTFRIAHWDTHTIVFPIPILTPLQNIAVHIVKAPIVRRIRTYSNRPMLKRAFPRCAVWPIAIAVGLVPIQ